MNFKNILFTLAKRHQLLQTFYLSMPNFLRQTIEINSAELCSRNLLSVDIVELILRKFGDFSNLQQTNSVKIDGQQYKVGMFQAHGADPPHPEFGKILMILLYNNCVFFLCRQYLATENGHLKCYELKKTDSLHILNLAMANDYLPYYAYKLLGKLFLIPKHCLFFSE